MSKEEINQNFDLERKKHFEFFLPFYHQQNWQLVDDNINSGKKNDWDVRLEIMAGQYVLVDEKAVRGEYEYCLVEIIQDVKTQNWGWFFSKSDWILWSNWADIESEYPSSLYLVYHKRLTKLINDLGEFQKVWIDKKGWGDTWNLILKWSDLIESSIAEKLV